MFKSFTAGLVALSLMMFPAPPAYAENRQDRSNDQLLGLLALGALGLAIAQNKGTRQHPDQQRPRVMVQRNANESVFSRNQYQQHLQRQNQQRRHLHQGRGRLDLLPGRCFRRVETGRGGFQAVFGARCLERRYRDAHTLPRQCAVRMGGPNGRRVGYEAGCLRDFGYRSDRRWN